MVENVETVSGMSTWVDTIIIIWTLLVETIKKMSTEVDFLLFF